MESRRKLELSKETLRDLTPEGLADVRGGGDQSFNTCLEVRCWIVFSPTFLDCIETQ